MSHHLVDAPSEEQLVARAYIIPLADFDEKDAPVIGAKAASLARMMEAGLPVPEAFSISSDAYRKHLNSSGLPPAIEAAIGRLTSATPAELAAPVAPTSPAAPADRRAVVDNLRRAIVAAPLSEELQRRIESAYGGLGSGMVAVRSSATAEDLPGHSFAGQHGTYFVGGPRDCLRAVKDCWASLWTERAFDYRARNGFDHLSVDMSVVVQRLIRADSSGVLFTADPVTGDPDKIIIEACFGLGEALVSGKVTPDRFVLAKNGLGVIEHKVSKKTVEVVPDVSRGAVERAVPADRAELPAIDETTARRLAELALEAERDFGCPQDMEWAIQGDELFFLQSRPITTLPSAGAPAAETNAHAAPAPASAASAAPASSPAAEAGRTWEERQVWSNLNSGEVLPDVVTPMTMSLLETLVLSLFNALFGAVGLRLGDNQLFGLVAGRVYFNLNTLLGAGRRIPGMRKMDLSKVLGGYQDKMLDQGGLTIADEDTPDFDFHAARMATGMPKLIRWFLSHSPRKGERFIEEARRKADGFYSIDLGALTEDGLAAYIRSTSIELLSSIDAVAYTGVGLFYFDALEKVCRRWLDDGQGSSANRLISGVGGMDSAQAGLELWHLAALAHENASVENAVVSGGDFESTRHRLEEMRGGPEFLMSWDGFMAAHGHHCRGELELANPRWAETPDYVLDMVRGYLGTIGRTDPPANFRKQADECEKLAERYRRSLRNPIKHQVFDLCFRQTKRGVVVRENVKSVGVRYIYSIRLMLLELGRRLARRNVLPGADDIFFLKMDEIDPVRWGEAGFDVSETVAERKAEHERNQFITPPAVVIGTFDAEKFAYEEQRAEQLDADPDSPDPDAARILEGLAVSSGVVTGPARVILRTDSEEQVLPGEILVAPFTDPGWTPYFLPAAAIVMDMGGLLSHGSIVAREYGIPAVVNAGPATKTIKTGQMIEVDGNRGTVKIL